MEYTTNYQLKKPKAEDYYNIEDFNDNADIIDGKLLVGAQAYSLVNQLLTRVKTLESDSSKLKSKTKILLDIYGMSETAVSITRSGYSSHQFSIGDSGYAQRELAAVGVWTITYTYNSVSYTTEVNIEYPGVTVVALAPRLEDCSWEFIDKVGSLGLAEKCWNVGDTKSLLIDGNEMQARILDFNYDKLWTQSVGKRKTAPITFGMTEFMPDSVKVHSSTEENLAWADREMFTEVLPSYKELMPDDLQSVIKRVSKVVMKPFHGESGQSGKTASVGCELLETDLFIFSEREIFGESRMSNPYYEYEKAYEYFARGSNFILSKPYWLRSCGYESYDAFKRALYVATTGSVMSDEMTRENWVIFGFCV